MFKSVALPVGVRYALSRRSSISIVSAVAVCGLALSVAVLVVVVSVFNGFEREFRQRVFGVLPHLSFIAQSEQGVSAQSGAPLTALESVAAVSPVVEGAGLAAADERVGGVLITGIDPQRHQGVSRLVEYVEGRLPQAAGAFEVALGAGLAEDLAVGVGDRVTLVLPLASVTPAGIFPRQKRFLVTGLVASQSMLDAQSAYIHIADAQRLFRLGNNLHGFQVRLYDLFDAVEAGHEGLASLLPGAFYARPWMRTYGPLYRAIGVQKSTMFLLLSLLVAVAAFNLVSTLVMVVDQRSSDVAILRTLGGDTLTLVSAFVLLGVLLGGIGIAAGTLLGSALAVSLPGLYEWASGHLAADLMSEYFINYLPVEVRLGDLLEISLTAAALCLVSTLYPALRVAGLRPAEVLAHE